MRAGLLGNESGQMEAWVYPLKVFRSFHLTFHVDGRALPAESLARTLIVHPESATLVYTGDNFPCAKRSSSQCASLAPSFCWTSKPEQAIGSKPPSSLTFSSNGPQL